VTSSITKINFDKNVSKTGYKITKQKLFENINQKMLSFVNKQILN